MKFVQIPDDQLVVLSASVVTGMSAPQFADAPVKTPALTALQTDYAQKVALARNGGRTEIAARNVARAAILAALRQNAAFVQMIAGTDLPLLLASGFAPTSTERTTGPLTKPVIQNVDNFQSTKLMLSAAVDDRTRAVEARYRVGTGPYQDGGVHTKASRILLEPFVPGSVVETQVRCVGGSTGYSDWSDPVSHMAT
jgi:hypothetical protein